MRRHAPLLALALASLAAGGCGFTGLRAGAPARVLHVSQDGDDRAPGSEARPLATLAEALARAPTEVVLEPGLHRGPALTVGGPLTLRGRGDATLAAALEVTGALRVEGLLLPGRLAARRGAHLAVRGSTLAGGLALDGARAELEGVVVRCSTGACLLAESSTVALRAVRVEADAAERGVRAERSRLAARGLRIDGARLAQLQAGPGTRADLDDVALERGRGNGLVALDGAVVDGRHVRVRGARDVAVLARRARVSLAHLEARAQEGPTAAFTGAEGTLRDAVLHAGRLGALTLAAHDGQPSTVRLVGGELRHGAGAGAQVLAGRLAVEGTRFTGTATASPRAEGGDAVLAVGVDAAVQLRGVHIEAPAGAGVRLLDDASGTITATIARPGTAGLRVDDAIAGEIRIVGSRIEGVRAGSGILALGTSSVAVDRTAIRGFARAGVLAGGGAAVTVERCAIDGEGAYGLAAFGGARVRLIRTRARAARWGAYATCTDGAEVEAGEGNALEGRVARCP